MLILSNGEIKEAVIKIVWSPEEIFGGDIKWVHWYTDSLTAEYQMRSPRQ